MTDDYERTLELVSDAGHILLENGAEISRVEETMQRMATHYGADGSSFFVLSNGIIASGHEYARAKFIPIKGTQLDKVVAVNQLSRDVVANHYTLDEVESRLKAIRSMPAKPVWEQILGSAVGAGGFCIIFGGSLFDSVAAFLTGALLWCVVLMLAQCKLSRLAINIVGGLVASILSLLFFRCGVGDSLPNMIVGAIIPLVPGVPFTNGIRDIANEDYIAGVTRLLDALLIFFCIALGVCIAFVVDAHISGKVFDIATVATDSLTAKIMAQALAALIGTSAFAILFGVPRKYYIDCGLTGAVGWLAYLLLFRYAHLSVAECTFFAALLVTLTSRRFAKRRRCPVTVFLICGIFPLVPGAGIFWTAYHTVNNSLNQALAVGLVSVKATVAIALGIIFIDELASIVKRRAGKRPRHANR